MPAPGTASACRTAHRLRSSIRLSKETNAILADHKVKARFADIGATLLAGSPADFGKLVAEETEKWGKVVKFAGIKAE
jgi:tripartite-type tricarboxylate transporter receptor subunit TctC